LLRHLERVAPTWTETLAVAYLDLHDIRCSTLSGWLTLLLNQLPRLLGPDFAPAVVDCQDPAFTGSPATFLRYLSRAVTRGLPRRRVTVQPLTVATLAHEPFAATSAPDLLVKEMRLHLMSYHQLGHGSPGPVGCAAPAHEQQESKAAYRRSVPVRTSVRRSRASGPAIWIACLSPSI
jgi:hypothetical protein